MKCVIEGNGVKVFGKAVHALSRIGEEIWLDPLEKGLALRSVSTAHSAYACFLFSPLFFQVYTPNLDQQQEIKSVKCKVSLKSVLPLFRSVSAIERNVYRCEISINITNSRVKFQFNCRHGITKTHNLGYQECEALQAVFPTHLCPNILKAQPKLLSDIVMHFPVSQEEITLSISPVRVKLKNYYEEENDSLKFMHTEMSLHPDEFDYFQVGVDSDITFCLKELRGLLSFAESHSLPVSVHFSSAGKPVCFSVEDMVLEAVVVLATLVSPVSETSVQDAPAHRNVSDLHPVNTSVTSPAHVSTQEAPVEAEDAGVAPQPPDLPVNEKVASSQGSPVFSPVLHMRKLLQLQEDHPAGPKTHQPALTTPITPATFKMRSLLFGAVFGDQTEAEVSELPSLVCSSDTEEDTAGDNVRVEE